MKIDEPEEQLDCAVGEVAMPWMRTWSSTAGLYDGEGNKSLGLPAEAL